MKKETYQKMIFEKVNADGSAKCEVCGKVSMTTHAVINHADNTVEVMCNDCYLKRLSRDEN
jgi:ribosome-binding protein aMBF1 (putative translation factor)